MPDPIMDLLYYASFIIHNHHSFTMNNIQVQFNYAGGDPPNPSSFNFVANVTQEIGPGDTCIPFMEIEVDEIPSDVSLKGNYTLSFGYGEGKTHSHPGNLTAVWSDTDCSS